MATVVALRPTYLPTKGASEYCSISKWGLLRARDRGEIRPAGKRGRTLTWAVDDLDKWMRGETTARTAEPSAPARRTSTSSNEAALARLAQLKAGSR